MIFLLLQGNENSSVFLLIEGEVELVLDIPQTSNKEVG